MPLPSRADVGARVVVRRRAGLRDGRPVYSDVVGILVTVSADRVQVRRRDGSLTTVDTADVVAAKVVPAAPVRSRPGSDTGTGTA